MTQPNEIPDELSFPSSERILEALNLAVKDAIAEHRRANIPLATIRDGKVVYVPAPPADPNDPPTWPLLK
ncbi:MAG: hypothetical protein NT069_08980 [Planctomycetota bacterium]|nr:hypothetical protein [Planctomycetota bacterium]